jgi:hypothetical protein
MRKLAIVLCAVLVGLVSAVSYAQAPVPFINLPLMPDATAPGGSQFTLTVNGTGFVSNSVVNWNGSALATQFVSGSKLTAIVPAADVATKGTGWVTVVNPAPGGGTSNVAFFAVAPNEGNSVEFTLAWSPAVGELPESAAVGDFNGDGKLDLAVANVLSNTVSILLGDGKGNFTLASSPVVGGEPQSVAVGDFNGDGKLDLAVANWSGNTVSILLGDGTGNFTLASSPAIDGPVFVAVGDFNGDGKLDLAVADGQNTISILLGDGTGNFTLASSPAVAGFPVSVAVGDFNGDGKLDLAVADGQNTISILLGDGTGNFTLAYSPAVGSGPESVVAGDFNGDGKLDLAVASGRSQTVSILLGDGTGNFTLASSPGVGCWPCTVAAGDFNGDGKLDLAVANSYGIKVFILLGDGTGHFTLASSPVVGSQPYSLAVGDFNGDGKLDLATGNNYDPDNTVSIVLQGRFPSVTLSPTSLTFGTQLIGTSSSPLPVTLTNNGKAALDIHKIATSRNSSETNNCPSSVPPKGQCTIYVSFVPAARGKLNGTVTIKDNAANSPQAVPLTGVGTVVSLLPSSLNFGDQKVGTTSQPQTVTLTNLGKGAVAILLIHFNGALDFAQTNNCGSSVPPGGTCTISVTFTPKYKKLRIATLDVSDNGGGSPQKVALSGTGD